MGEYKTVTYHVRPDNFIEAVRKMLFVEILQGLALTFKYMFTKPFAMRYPEHKWIMPKRMKGAIAMVRDPETPDQDLCVACGMCIRICPSGNALFLESAQGENNKKIIVNYHYNLLRCIFCGLCVEICPVDALIYTNNYETADFTRESLFFDKESFIKVGMTFKKYEKFLKKKGINHSSIVKFKKAKWTMEKPDLSEEELEEYGKR